MADYLEAYWKSTHPASCTPANPLLDKLTAAQSANPEPLSSLHLQVLTKLLPAPTPGIGEGQESRRGDSEMGIDCKGENKEENENKAGTRLWSRRVVVKDCTRVLCSSAL